MPREENVPRFFLVLMAGTSILLAGVLLPIAAELLLAIVLASLLWPVQAAVTRWLRGRRGVAAGLVTLGVVVLLLGPVAALLALVVTDGAAGVRFVADTAHSPEVADLAARLPGPARDFVLDAIAKLPRTFDEAAGQVGAYGGQVAGAVGAVVAATGSVLLHTTLMLIALFFLLVHGDELVSWLDSVSPLRRGQTRELLGAFRKVSIAVIVSTVITSAVQAVAALAGYYIARVPNPLFFATVTFFVAFIPAIGAAVVCLAAAGLLVLTGHPYAALFLAVWGVVVVGLVDNVIKPLLVKRGMEMHGAIVFFSLFGGLAAFGAIGLLIGPMAVALFLALVRMYHRDFTPAEERVPPVPGLPGTPGEPSPP